MSTEAKTMKAVVFEGPKKVSVQDRPIPELQDPRDIIVKVQMTALCGSELHTYRGRESSTPGFIMGHEFTGVAHSVGSSVTTIKVGDKIVAPFTVSCGTCFYCNQGFSSRCESSLLFGSAKLDGGQAEYVRIPLADGTAVVAPPEIEDERALVLMADIFPTGYYGATSAFELMDYQHRVKKSGSSATGSTVVVVGCGPVGLCAIVSALEFKPKHLFAVDCVESRLQLAKELGAEPLNFADVEKGGIGLEGMVKRVKEVTEGRGADAVIEVVGSRPALKTAVELVRPFGVISSIGVQGAYDLPWTGADGYNKNLRVQMGRCPVRSIFREALEVMARNQHKFSFMFDKIMPLAEAVEGYDLFDNMKAQKVIFKPW
ncbi:chaperonin 10-like protein [Sordaria brevicollis]|uniref:Chaperonin 10-like protein n=1 Tax=Sordaria brevicollis TaxID=83679 RepID=A0AAE0NV57_SORBR|nr:chaperonin 10-like protein [Sordaria brevicollis]